MKRWSEILLVCALLAGCASTADKQTEQNVPAESDEVTAAQVEENEDKTSIEPKVLYLLLAAELAGQRNEYDVALDGYLQAAKLVNDPRIAERAAKIALFLKDGRRTTEAVNLWLDRDPNNLTAQRLAVLSALQSGDKAKAVEHFNAVLRLDPAGFEATLMEVNKVMVKNGKDENNQSKYRGYREALKWSQKKSTRHNQK